MGISMFQTQARCPDSISSLFWRSFVTFRWAILYLGLVW
jgi:hypothetical protein